MKTLDCRAQQCPHPVVETRKALLSDPNSPLRVLVGDDTARENVSRLAASQGYTVSASPLEGGYALDLSPAEDAGRPKDPGQPFQGKTVLFLGSDTMGSGDDELGHILLKNFLFTLAETGNAPEAVLAVNAGVKLTTAGSEVLEALEKLACLGADIASCGLCLEFYHLQESLSVGRTTNMLEIVETLQKAGRIIRP